MTGWRLGYIGGPLEVVEACNKLQSQVTSGANAFAQKAAAFALEADLTPTYKMRDQFEKRRDLIIGLLKEIPGLKVNHPKGAFYVFPDCSAYFGKSDGSFTINNSADFSEYLLMSALVATVPGDAFGANDCFRISYAASEADITEAVRRIGEALAKLS
jgi:aspartate aminotransferase